MRGWRRSNWKRFFWRSLFLFSWEREKIVSSYQHISIFHNRVHVLSRTFRDCPSRKGECRLTALSAFPTFWHAIGIRAVCMAAGSWYSILPQHRGMPRYLRRLCIRVRRIHRSWDRRDVWSRFAYDVAPADPVVSEVHSRLCTCANSGISVPLVYVHESHKQLYAIWMRLESPL